jgi:hypothetical protein
VARSIGVRPRTQDPLQASQVSVETRVTLPDGLSRVVCPSDWLITRNGQVIEVCPDAVFAKYWEEKQAGLQVPELVKARLEETLGIGTTNTPIALVEAVEQLADLKIGEVRVPFTPQQLHELKTRAEKRGITIEAEVRRVIEYLTGEIFWTT